MICKRDLPHGATRGRSVAIKKTALMVDHELVDQVQGAARHHHHQRDHRGGDARGHPRPGPGPPLRAAAAPRARARCGQPTSLTPAPWRCCHGTTSRPGSCRLIVGGGAATCGIVDLEVLSAFDQSDRHEVRHRAGDVRRGCPSTTRCWTGRSRCRPRSRAAIRVIALIVAAAAERAGLVLLHDDDAFDEIAAVTGQPTERAASSRRDEGPAARPGLRTRASRKASAT